ncbi:MAG: lyase family protein, partial [Candidatus Hydrothermarchaeaceae archaeon]
MENSMDAVSSRDFITETLFCLAAIEANVSRLASELILWSTKEFGFIEISDEFSSTSSIMPQKKNPDILEIMRARSSKVHGSLAAALSMVRGLSNSYNRDFQELSPLLGDSFKITKESLFLLGKIIKTLKINKERMADACEGGFITATELSDLLVKEKGLPFRTAHRIVGGAVRQAIKEGKGPSEIDLDFLGEVPGWPGGISESKIKDALSPFSAVKMKNHPGAPAPDACIKAISEKAQAISKREAELSGRMEKVENSKILLLKTAKKLAGG